jgi:hypothetical protein
MFPSVFFFSSRSAPHDRLRNLLNALTPLPLLVACNLALFLVPAKSHAQSCYIEAIKACKAALGTQRKACTEGYKQQSPACKEKRQSLLQACAAQHTQHACVREKITPEKTALCEKKKSDALAACQKPSESVECKTSFLACKQNCMRNCRVCTAEGIKPCTEACETNDLLCQHKAEDTYTHCVREANSKERQCLHQEKLENWSKHLDCTKKRLLDRLNCQYNAYHQERLCWQQLADQRHVCRRKSSAEYKLCTAQSREKCKR